MDVYLLQHLIKNSNNEDSIKVIGIYSSFNKANEAIARLSKMSGFCDYPNLIDPLNDVEEEGFYIDKYFVDETQWKEGFN